MVASEPGGGGVAVTSHTYDPERQFYVAGLAQELLRGHSYILSMQFVAHLQSHLKGFFRVQYKDEAGNERWVLTTV